MYAIRSYYAPAMRVMTSRNILVPERGAPISITGWYSGMDRLIDDFKILWYFSR